MPGNAGSDIVSNFEPVGQSFDGPIQRPISQPVGGSNHFPNHGFSNQGTNSEPYLVSNSRAFIGTHIKPIDGPNWFPYQSTDAHPHQSSHVLHRLQQAGYGDMQ
jgi:hypothetical protein